MNPKNILSVAIALGMMTTQALAQGVGAAAGPVVHVAPESELPGAPAWGTSSFSYLVMPATQFTPPNSTATYNTFVSGAAGAIGLFQTNAAVDDWWVGFQVPAGSQILSLVVEACDTTGNWPAAIRDDQERHSWGQRRGHHGGWWHWLSRDAWLRFLYGNASCGYFC